jgi:hypothetical protein
VRTVEADSKDAPLAEVTKVKETAERLANGEAADGVDQVRILAGLVFQLAEQIERLEQGGEPSSPS